MSSNSHRNSTNVHRHGVAVNSTHLGKHIEENEDQHDATQVEEGAIHSGHDDFGANYTDEEADAASIAAMDAWGLKDDASAGASYEPEFKASLSGLSGAHGEVTKIAI